MRVYEEDLTDTIPDMVPRTTKHRQVLWGLQPHLACRAGRANDRLFIIQYLPLYLGESAQACLEQLPVNSIHLWVELKRIFMGNFQGTYVCPGNFL